MATAAELLLLIKADASGLDKGVGQAKSSLGSLGGIASGAGKAIAGGLALGGAAAIGLGASAIKMAGDFQTQMKQVETLGADFGRPFSEVQADVSKLATTMGIDATNAATTLYNAVSAGVPPGNALEFMEAAAKAAVGGAADLDAVGSAMSVAMNSWGDSVGSATDITDGLFQVVKMGVTTVPELAANLGQASGIAAAAGVSFNEYGAALAQITTKGKTTSVASTQLKGILSEIMTPTSKATAAFIEMGYANGQAAIEALGFQGALDALGAKAGDMGQPITALFGSVEAGGAALDLTGENAAAFSDKLAGMESAAGNSQAALDKVNEGFNRQMDLLKSLASGALRDIGVAVLPALTGALSDMMPTLQAAATAFSEWLPGALDTMGDALSGVGALLAPVADAVGRFMEGFQNGTDDGMMPFTSALSGVAEMLDGLIPEPVVDAIRNFAGAFEQAAEVLSGSKDAVTSYNPVVQALGDVFVAVGQTIAAWVDGAKAVFLDVQGAVTILADAFRQHFDTIAAKVGEVWDWIDANVVPVVEQVVSDVVEKVTELREQFDEHFGGIQGAVKAVVDWFNANVAPTLGAVFGFIGEQLRQMWALFEFILPALQLAFSGAFDVIVAVVQTAFGVLKGIVEAGLALMRGDFQGVAEGIRDAMSSLVRGIIPIFVGLFKTVVGIIGAAIPVAIAAVVKLGEGIINGLVNAIAAGVSIVTGAIVGLVKGVIKSGADALGVKSPSTVFYEIGANVVEGFRLGLLGMEEVIQWINDVLGKTIGAKDVKSLEQVARAAEAIRDTAAAVIDTITLLADADIPAPGALEARFRELIGGFEGVIEKMRQISLFADKDKLPEFGYQLSKWDVANVNAVSGALKSITDLIKGLADAVKAAGDMGDIDASVFARIRTAAEGVGGLAVDLAASFGGSFGTESASKAAKSVADSIKAFADVMNTVADMRLGEVTDLAAADVAVMAANAKVLIDGLWLAAADFVAAGSKALDALVGGVEAYASTVKAAVDAFTAAGSFKIGDAVALAASDMAVFQNNARVLLDAVWVAATGFRDSKAVQNDALVAAVQAFVDVLTAAGDALAAGKAAADGMAEATELDAAAMTAHLVHLRDVLVPAVVAVVDGWEQGLTATERLTERINTFVDLISAAVGAHDAVPRGELDTAITIDAEALRGYLAHLRDVVLPVVTQAVADWDSTNEAGEELTERIDTFVDLINAAVGAHEAVPTGELGTYARINADELALALRYLTFAILPVIEQAVADWDRALDETKDLTDRVKAFVDLIGAATGAHSAVPTGELAAYTRINADDLALELKYLRDGILPVIEDIVGDWGVATDDATALATRVKAFADVLGAVGSAIGAMQDIGGEGLVAVTRQTLDVFVANARLLFQAIEDVMAGGLTAEIATARAAVADAAGTIADGLGSVLEVIEMAVANPFARIRAGGQRGETFRTNLRNRLATALRESVGAVQDALSGITITVPEGIETQMKRLADAFSPILDIIERLGSTTLDLSKLRALALAPAILAAGLTPVETTQTAGGAGGASIIINNSFEPTVSPLPITINTTNNNTITVGDRVIDAIAVEVVAVQEAELRLKP